MFLDMKRCLRAVLALVTFVGILGVPLMAAAESMMLPQAQIDVIRQNCTTAQQTLSQLEKRDAVARINRGRAYDVMVQQVSAFNSRLAYNKVSLPQMVQLTNDLQSHIDHFRNEYTAYDNTLTSAIRINCKDKPSDFYTFVTQARDQRAAVGEEVTQLERLSAQYRTELVNYQNTLPAVTGGASQ